ncbi:hypothetical protein LRAMOSA07520 [Lichtheimia ramosa]|uniref:Post-GPI attachment to proteins factor 3 n=1 Tax=Lichtheimia ramosa TaxID=688394 RepID=A0A077WC63_9FUNG|nr:hypothetical protein LRAMOSA07520 [Lichtheimia ramosa]
MPWSRLCCLVAALWVLILCFGRVNALEGDEMPEFIDCLGNCTLQHCDSNNDSSSLPLYLRAFFWSCPDNCGYNCMHEYTDTHSPMVQFYGKWPFYRLFGIQEPASVAFSIGNGLVHFYYLRVALLEIPPTWYMQPFVILYAAININTWIQSSIFHSRDLPVTERLDYFGAALTIMYSLYYAIIRIFSIERRAYQVAIACGLMLLYLVHVLYMSLVSFNYVYNMIACGAVAVIQGALWIVWYLVIVWQCRRSNNMDQQQEKNKVMYEHWVVYYVAANAATVMLEVFDFPPLWRVFDAHSLWHMSTIFVAPLWYHFVLQDARYQTNWRMIKQNDDDDNDNDSGYEQYPLF